jgi:chorismate--pyruvate lyase
MSWSVQLPAERRLRDWLVSPGSLTHRIKLAHADFRVQRLRQQAARPNPDEIGVLGLRAGRLALVREVVLFGSSRPLVYGHSVVALRHLDGPWRAVCGLGIRPLAEALYIDPAIRREPLAYRRLDARHPLYRRVCADLGDMPATLWARRSLFRRQGAPLLVTEVFLPQIVATRDDLARLNRAI